MTTRHDIKTIRQGDPDFNLTDGIAIYPRAVMQITSGCPQNIKEYIHWAYNNGYIQCVAHVQGKELTWEKLTND